MNRLNRLALMTCIGLLSLTGWFAVFAADWAAYQQAFVAGDGRVRDPSQNSITSSPSSGSF